MAELSYPTSGGGSVTDSRYEQLAGRYAPSGLLGEFNAAQPLVYADSTGRQIKVRANRAAIVRGFRWETDSAGLTVAVAANASGQPRHDRVVLRLDRATWTVSLQIIQGNPSSSPYTPDYAWQETGSTGVWELRLARIYVAPNAVTIAAGDVQNQAFHLGGFNYRGEKNWAPYPVAGGNLFYAHDNARLYAAVGGDHHIVGEAGAMTSQGAGASGWDTKWIYYQRWNGSVFFTGLPTRTGGTLSAGTDSTICTIPVVYRPAADMFLVAWAGNAVMRCWIDASTGQLRLLNYGVNFSSGWTLAIHPVTWPANNS